MIFYDGKGTWTAEKNFLNRTNLNQAFEKYIPKFEYEVVNLTDYTEEGIMRFGDALSFVLLIDKLRNKKGECLLSRLPDGYLEKIRLQILENMSKLLSEVIRVFLKRSG